MRLTEPFHLLYKEGIYITVGKQINKEFAICKTRSGRYTITFIETGTAASCEYETYKIAFEAVKDVLRKVNSKISVNPDLFCKNINAQRVIFDKFIDENKFLN